MNEQEVPGIPHDVKVMDKSQVSVQLSWAAPDRDASIQQYQIEYKISEGSWERVSVSGRHNETTITELRPGTIYHLRIVAVNNVGNSEPSDTIRFITLEDAPSGPPIYVSVEATNSHALNVWWKPPQRALWNGRVLGYKVCYRRTDNNGAYIVQTVFGLATNHLEIDKLKPNTPYLVTVEAFNKVGSGPRSKALTKYTAEDAPEQPPRNVTCTAITSQRIRVSWDSPPLTTKNGVPKGYKVIYRPSDLTDENTKDVVVTSSSQTFLDGLHKYTNYSVQVLAYTGGGDGVLSDPVQCQTEEDLPDEPTKIKVIAKSADSVLVSWEPPTKPNGIIEHYTVYVKEMSDESSKAVKLSCIVPPTQVSYEVSELDKTKSYEFYVTASTYMGEGESSPTVRQSLADRRGDDLTRRAIMEESFPLSWHEGAGGDDPSREEVICGIDNSCAILQSDVVAEEYGGSTSGAYQDVACVASTDYVVATANDYDGGAVGGYGGGAVGYEEVCEEVVVQEGDEMPETIIPDENQANVLYMENDNVLVMQPQTSVGFQDQFMECQVTEEVITGDWVNPHGEERVEIPVGEVGAEQQIEYDDDDIPLPTDQDEYTASHPYPCDFCSRRFRKKANLMNHMVAHQTDRPHACNLCGARYIRKCDLMNHLKIHAYVPDSDGMDEDDSAPLQDTDKPKKRKSSKKRKSQGSKSKIKEENDDEHYESTSRTYNYVEEDVRLLTEMDSGAGSQNDYLYAKDVVEPRYPILDARKPFVCQHCGVAFAREKALASHARIHAGDSPFECESCNEMFWDVNKMKEHIRLKHGGENIPTDYEDIDDGDYVEENRYGEFYCTICGVRFHRQDLLKRHVRSHDVKEEFNDDMDFGHVCNTCGQTFAEALDLLAHAEVHARQGHRCMLCGECFTDEGCMATHVMQRHGKNMPPNSCMLCGKTCKDRRTLLKHSWDHSREKLFSCSKCGKSFHNKARLKRHMVSHRNKAVQCDVCGEDFPDGRSLMNHRHSHSNISGRQFPCRECGKTFGSRSSQQIHIRIHTGERPYGCRYCWKAFADGGTLRKHERIHTGEKPYACAVCPRAFNQRVVLREHIRSHHSGPDPHYSHTMTPYCCSVCNDMFSTSQDLIVHLIHHCDMNTAMKRQPQVGPRKYKRRRKLKPHELELISGQELEMEAPSEDEERNRRPVRPKKPRTPNKTSLEKDYESVFQSFESAIQNISSIVNSKPPANKGRKKAKVAEAPASVVSRPKMIHTQKTRVPLDAQNDGKGRHKTKTLITRTTPSELARQAQVQGERNRPRTKNVSYHILNPEKYPAATFDEQITENIEIKPDPDAGGVADYEETVESEYQTIETEIPDVANEETVLAHVEEVPGSPTSSQQSVSMVKVAKTDLKKNNSLTPGRHIIGPGNKVIRIVKGGMLISNKLKKESAEAMGDMVNVVLKQEVVEPSPLHELAELSMQHAQNQFRCEMCSATFTDRSQLLMHVPIHI